MKDLYTLLLDYRGGTYVSQVTVAAPEKAFQIWIDGIDLKGMGVNAQSGQISDIDKDLVALKDLKNVWCTTFLIDNELALVNIVKTSP